MRTQSVRTVPPTRGYKFCQIGQNFKRPNHELKLGTLRSPTQKRRDCIPPFFGAVLLFLVQSTTNPPYFYAKKSGAVLLLTVTTYHTHHIISIFVRTYLLTLQRTPSLHQLILFCILSTCIVTGTVCPLEEGHLVDS